MAQIIAADEIKKTLPGYDPSRSGDFHRDSARLADKAYEAALRDGPEGGVILMAGGAASGKSEYVSAYLGPEDAVVLDGTMPSFEGASIKIRGAVRAGKRVEVRLVVPADLSVAFVVFLNRERKFAVRHFFDTHVNSRKAALAVAEAFPSVPVRIIESDVDFVGDGGTMGFRELQFPDRHSLVDYLRLNQYTQAEIRNKIYHDA